MDKYIGLRHDVDTDLGLRKGVVKTIEIEYRYDVRSTFFIRSKLLDKADKDIINYLLEIEKDGWEIGLHLDNIWGLKELPSPQSELDKLRSFGFRVKGATPHGGDYKVKDPRTWKTLDMLNVDYIQGSREIPNGLKTLVLEKPVTLDWFIKREGAKKGYNNFKKRLMERLLRDGYAVVMTHPEYFVISTGIIGGLSPRSSGVNVKITKFFNKLFAIILTPTKSRMTIDVYRRFLSDYREYNFVTLYELARLVKDF